MQQFQNVLTRIISCSSGSAHDPFFVDDESFELEARGQYTLPAFFAPYQVNA